MVIASSYGILLTVGVVGFTQVEIAQGGGRRRGGFGMGGGRGGGFGGGFGGPPPFGGGGFGGGGYAFLLAALFDTLSCY